MAQVDTSIYNALLQRPKSVLEWQNEYAAQDDAAQTRQLNALNMREAQAKAGDSALARQDQMAIRNALAGLAPDAEMEARVKALRGTATPLGYTQAQEIEKAAAEAARVRSQTEQADQAAKHSKYQIEAAQAKTAVEKHDRALSEMLGLQNPQQAMESLRRHAAEGSIGQAEVQAVSRQLMGLSTPEQWQEWQDNVLYRIQDAKGKAELLAKRLEWAAKQREAASTQANRDLIEDPTRPGRFIANAPLQEFKLATAKAGAPKTEVKINEGQKGFENETKLRDNFKQEPTYKAHQEMDSAHRQIKAALSKADPISDMAAATKIMKLLDPGSVVRESELGMAMAATGLLDRVTAFVPNIMNGTKLTPAQRVEFGQLADALYAESVKQYDLKRNEYQKLGADYGLNAERALGTVARPAPPPSKPKSAPAMGAGVPDDIAAILKKHGRK